MTDPEDQLREAFATHHNEVPDPAAVYERVQELSRKYRRRRRVGQAAGAGVLGAGLIAGAVQLPAMLPGNAHNTSAIVAPAAGPSSAAPTEEQELNAFFNAGYSYEDAQRLAKAWNMPPENITAVKAEAGRRLLAGETLPIQPTPAESTSPEENKAISKFFDSGYQYEDAEKLAKLWKLSSPYDAKIEAGKKLLAGETLPIKPSPAGVASALESKRDEAFFKAGYVYEDAERLAKLWKLKDAGAAKAEGGRRLLAGQTLPFKPKPENVQAMKDSAAYDAFFNAGYDYTDALQLAKLWGLPNASAAKVAAGKKLLAGQTLPIKP